MKDTDRELTIRITTGTIIRALFTFAIFYFVYQFFDLVLVILTAVVLASAIEPATAWFVRYKVPRTVSVIVIYVLIIASFAGILYAIVPSLLTEIASIDATYNVSGSLSEYVEDGASGDLSVTGVLTDLERSLTGNTESALPAISRIFGSIVSFVLIIVFSFYLAVQKHGVTNLLRIIIPEKHERYAIDLWRRTQHKIGLWMQGQLVLGFIIGVLVFLGLSLMQVPYALLLALVAAMFEIIPIFGPILAAIPAVLLAFTHGISFVHGVGAGMTSAIAVALFYVIIQQFENHLIYPLVVRKVVGVPPLLVIIALVVGARAAGFLGIILAVPIAAAFMELLNDIEKRKGLAKKTS